MKTRQSFTLIEMLIVVAIIMILAAAMLVAFGKAPEKARNVRCASNLRQLHTAAMNHAIDGNEFPCSASYEGKNPDGKWSQWDTGWVDWYKYTPGSTSPGGMGGDDLRTFWWGNQGITCITNGSLYKYTRDRQIYYCPTFALKKTCGANDTVRSYSMNSQMSRQRMLWVKSAARKILFADPAVYDRLRKKAGDTPPSGTRICFTGLRGGAQFGYDWNSSLTYNWNSGGSGSRKHYMQLDGELMGYTNNLTAVGLPDESIGDYHEGGKGNAVFVDGHVRRVKCNETISACFGDWGDY
jgi:prepilin-type processing-associated H-X9-DG protein